jgi:hypothetical protein
VRQPLWQRRRRAEERDATANPSDPAPAAGDGDGASDGQRQPADIRARLRDLESIPERAPDAGTGAASGDDGVDRQAAYAAWADRMRSHKKDKLAGIVPDPDEPEPSKATVSPHWDSSTLFVSIQDEGPPAPALMGTRELLAVLALEEGATEREVQSAFRRLAKEHHPDRWHDAPPEERAGHEVRMSLIVEVHAELRRRFA